MGLPADISVVDAEKHRANLLPFKVKALRILTNIVEQKSGDHWSLGEVETLKQTIDGHLFYVHCTKDDSFVTSLHSSVLCRRQIQCNLEPVLGRNNLSLSLSFVGNWLS